MGLALGVAAMVFLGPVAGMAGFGSAGSLGVRPASSSAEPTGAVQGDVSGPGGSLEPGGSPPGGNLVPGGAPPLEGMASNAPAIPADLPACRYAQKPAVQRPSGDWILSILDTEVRLPVGYVPPHMVDVSHAGLSGGGEVRDVIMPDLTALVAAADAAGFPLMEVSAYRSETKQQVVFDGWVDSAGEAAARKSSARPGHSEHQLGLAVDFAASHGSAPWDQPFGDTDHGHWLAAHAADYGFVMSYPKGAEAVTCYAFEPWHFRWVGRDIARQVVASGLPLRAWLWSTRNDAG